MHGVFFCLFVKAWHCIINSITEMQNEIIVLIFTYNEELYYKSFEINVLILSFTSGILPECKIESGRTVDSHHIAVLRTNRKEIHVIAYFEAPIMTEDLFEVST